MVEFFKMKIILIMGLPGSGKTTLANELAPMY
jgi:adenylate kinase family enzyme